jgi:hypothetical protein
LPSGIGKTHETSSVPRHYPGEALDLQHLDGSKDLGMRIAPKKGTRLRRYFIWTKDPNIFWSLSPWMPRKVQIIPQFELYEIFYDSVYHRENHPTKTP